MPIILQQIGVGAAPNDGNGDPGRTAFIKVNENMLVIAGALEDAELKSFVTVLGGKNTVVAVEAEIESYRMPFAFVLTEVRAEVREAQSGGDIVFDVLEEGVSILNSNKLVIPAGSDTSYGFSPDSLDGLVLLENNNRVSFDILDVGSGATAVGAKVTLIGYVIWTTF